MAYEKGGRFLEHSAYVNTFLLLLILHTEVKVLTVLGCKTCCGYRYIELKGVFKQITLHLWNYNLLYKHFAAIYNCLARWGREESIDDSVENSIYAKRAVLPQNIYVSNVNSLTANGSDKYNIIMHLFAIVCQQNYGDHNG